MFVQGLLVFARISFARVAAQFQTLVELRIGDVIQVKEVGAKGKNDYAPDATEWRQRSTDQRTRKRNQKEIARSKCFSYTRGVSPTGHGLIASAADNRWRTAAPAPEWLAGTAEVVAVRWAVANRLINERE